MKMKKKKMNMTCPLIIWKGRREDKGHYQNSHGEDGEGGKSIARTSHSKRTSRSEDCVPLFYRVGN